MARIPDQLPLDAVEGPQPSTAAVAPTDFGLGAAAQEAEAVGAMQKRTQMLQIRVQAEADRKAVAPDVQALTGALADQLTTEAPNWNGTTPGFAADQIAKARALAAKTLADKAGYTPGQRAEFSQAADQTLAALGQRAIQHEAAVLGQNAVDQQEVQANGAMTGFYQAFAPAKQALLDGYDGSQKGLVTAGLQAFDQAAQTTLQSVPAPLQSRMQAKLAAMRVEEAATLGAVEQHGADAYVLKNGTDQAYALINTISSNPAAYDSVVANGLPAIVATVPPGLRKDALTEFQGLAAQARINGLVTAGNFGQAQTELRDGRYDAVLKPEVKDTLMARVQAENRAHGPEGVSLALQGIQLRQRLAADINARATTGQSSGVDLDAVAWGLSHGAITPEEFATYQTAATQADRNFALVGPIRDQPTSQVHAALATPPPQPADPDYATKFTDWQTQQQAAAAELKARQNPGALVFSINTAKGKGAAGAGAGQDRGAMLNQAWQAYSSAPTAQGGQALASQSLGAQAHLGIAPGAYQLIPQESASTLAASVINAAPEQRLAALQSVAALVRNLPQSLQLPDGSTVSPQAILSRQLQAAHLTPMELSAIADYETDAAKLGRFTAALNDPTLKQPMVPGQKLQLQTAVQSDLGPYLAAIRPLPGAQNLEQARIDRTLLIARSLMNSQGLSASAAAKAAAADLTGGYRMIDTMAIPTSAGIGTTQARKGASYLLSQLITQDGRNVFAPPGLPGTPDDQRRLYAQKIDASGRWVTLPDDSGVTLMVPKTDGSWDQVSDRYGRPVRATWPQLQARFDGGDLNAPANPFAQPPPGAVVGPDGQPMAAFSKVAAMGALAWAVNGRESGFRGGLASPAGALGQMQVKPETAAPYALRLFGQPLDVNRLQHDDAYNRQIGTAVLADAVNRYGAGPGIGLALAAYNAGPGRLEGYRDPKTGQWRPGWLQTIGDPRTGKISLTDFVSRIPNQETRAYVQAVLPAALKRLQGPH
jgi:hypothetical protein